MTRGYFTAKLAILILMKTLPKNKITFHNFFQLLNYNEKYGLQGPKVH